MLAGNSSISLAGSEEQITFFQQSPKMLKIVSENFIHALLLLVGLFLKISPWVPLHIRTPFRTPFLFPQKKRLFQGKRENREIEVFTVMCIIS